MVVLSKEEYLDLRRTLTTNVEQIAQDAANMNRAAIDRCDNSRGDANFKKASDALSNCAAEINLQAAKINDIIAKMDDEFRIMEEETITFDEQ